MLCANSNGSHRITPLVIGKFKKPIALKNIRKMPVIYASQKKVWMNREVFEKWFFDTFIPEVKKYQRTTGHIGKVILILDNAQSHPNLILSKGEAEIFRIIFLPPNVTALLQPMDQSVIHSFKLIFKGASLYI